MRLQDSLQKALRFVCKIPIHSSIGAYRIQLVRGDESLRNAVITTHNKQEGTFWMFIGPMFL